MLRRRKSVRERQVAFFVMALVGFTACGIFESDPPEDDEDEDNGGSAGAAAKPSGGNSGNAGTAAGGTGAVPQGGDAGTSAGGTLGGTSPITGGTPSTGGSLPTGGTPAGGALPTGGTPAGGALPTGGTPATGGSGGGTPITCGAGWAVSDGGFVTAPGASGCWRGYAYTGTGSVVGSTITPTSFGTCGSPCMLCASGTVAADIDYAGIALLGFNVNQMSDSDVAGTVMPTGTGLTVSFTNPGGSPLRIQIGGPNASTSETDRWCYNLSGSSGTITIPYTGFSTTCWNTTGVAYAKQPLQTVQLLVPGDDLTAVPFNICLTGVADG